jgi:hypothetical protein
MITSDFRPTAPRRYSTWQKWISFLLLYGLGVPVVRLLDVLGGWPRIIAAAARRTTSDSFGAYEPTGADVFVCAGFKSGTTWVLQIATQIAFRGRAEFSNIHHVVPWPDAPPLAHSQIIPLTNDSPRRLAPTGLRIIKSHLPREQVPFSPVARYIAVVRDPKDVMVSGYYFMKSMVFGPLMPSVRHWVDLNLSGSAGHGSWAHHLASFWRERHRDNVLFLTFETLKRDLPGTVATIARFMQVELTEAELTMVVEASSWDAMKRNEGKFDPGQILPWTGRNYFLRRGQSGSSGELLSRAMQLRIDTACRAKLERLQCDFPYDQVFQE